MKTWTHALFGAFLSLLVGGGNKQQIHTPWEEGTSNPTLHLKRFEVLHIQQNIGCVQSGLVKGMSARQTPDALPSCKWLEANGASGLVPNALLLHLGRGYFWTQLRNTQNSKQQKITEPAALPKELVKKYGNINLQLDGCLVSTGIIPLPSRRTRDRKKTG